MLLQNNPDRIRILFDDHRLVANAGLLLPATLARHLGLRELVDHHLDLGGAPGRANTGDKIADTMEPWAKAAGLKDEQVQALKEHHKDCTNTRAELTRTSRTLEGELGYLLYAMAEFSTREEILEDQIFRQLLFRWNLVRVRREDEEHIRQTILPSADQTANRIALAWEKESNELTRPYVKSKPELHQDIRWLAQALAKKEVLEHLRHEFFGRNSSTERVPHPHSDCAASIVETGQVQPFPREFEEDVGYKSSEL